MTKEELIELKNKLSLLSEEEKLKRESYLKDLGVGNIYGPNTGYPSIDLPATRYYNYNDNSNNIKETVTAGLFRQNADHLDDVALEFFLSKITYKELKDNILSLVKSLNKEGISKGDTIGFALPGIPESFYAAYASWYLGSISMFMPPWLDKENMISDLNHKNTKLLFIMDLFYSKFKEVYDEVIEKSSVERVIIVPTLNSSVLGKIKKKADLKNKMFIYYNDFIDEGKQEKLPEIVEYEENMPATVVYSSGTTGKLKGILLSHDSIMNSALSYKKFGFDLARGQRFFQAIPPFASTGLIANGTSPLYYGSIVHQNPVFDPFKFSKSVGFSQSNWAIGTTELFNGLDRVSKNHLLRLLLHTHILDYSHLTNAYVGGTPTTKNDKEKLNNIFKSLGSSAVTNSSYGRCEDGSIVTAELNYLPHYNNSIGIPIPGAVVIAVDENKQELPYGQRGELAVKTECGMIDYYNRPGLDDGSFTDGLNTYRLTSDIGYITPDGFVIYEGRGNDYSIINGNKIYNFDIKNTVLEDEDIFDCEVSIVNEKLALHIIFKNEISNLDEKYTSIQNLLYEKYQDISYVPELFKIRNSFPMASSTKRDYISIRNETDGFSSHIYEKGYSLSRKCDIL